MNNPLIYIEWGDAAIISSDWEGIDEVVARAKEDDLWLVCEVGFVLDETDEYLLLASQITNTGSAGSVMKIPTPWIKKRIELTSHIK